MSWKTFPKIELHLHLEGAADPAFIRGLTQAKTVDIGGISDAFGAYRYSGLGEVFKASQSPPQASHMSEAFQVPTH